MKRACGEVTTCAGSYGVFDMSGNVNEWSAYNGVTPRICGGYFGTTSNYSGELACSTTCAGAPSQYTANEKIGYRCCVDSPN